MFQGRSHYPGQRSAEAWDGIGTIQAKFRVRPQDPANNARWLLTQLKKYLNSPSTIITPYLVVATNVVLAPATRTGGIDRVTEWLQGEVAAGRLRDFAIWHCDQICRFLDDAPAIRDSYGALVSSGDVLVALRGSLPGSLDVEGILTRHVAKEMLTEQWVRLGETGDVDNQRLSLGAVAVDLPMTSSRSGRSNNLARFVLRHGDLDHRRTGQAKTRHLVIVGGPGQGKTTIGQLICQAYRSAFLQRTQTSYGPSSDRLRERLAADLAALDLPVPSSKRWPVRIGLADYSDALLADPGNSLIKHIAHRANLRTAEKVRPDHVQAWLGSWPWIVVLDGFDEVVAPHARERTMEAVSDFIVDAESVKADLLIVATTRPQGYAGEFTPKHYEHLSLTPLTPSHAIDYARRLASVRHSEDPDLQSAVINRIEEAATEPLTARLMRSPLQVTIMSLLLERRTRVPRRRYELFDAYYDTIYAREVAKPGRAGQVLGAHKPHIDAIHEHVALTAHIRAETRLYAAKRGSRPLIGVGR